MLILYLQFTYKLKSFIVEVLETNRSVGGIKCTLDIFTEMLFSSLVHFIFLGFNFKKRLNKLQVRKMFNKNFHQCTYGKTRWLRVEEERTKQNEYVEVFFRSVIVFIVTPLIVLKLTSVQNFCVTPVNKMEDSCGPCDSRLFVRQKCPKTWRVPCRWIQIWVVLRP